MKSKSICIGISTLLVSVSDPDPDPDPYGSVWIRIIWSDPDPYQETIDMDPGSVKN